jgi:C4-dicarboxylate-specific signal transduction histidine kinase
MRIAANLAAAVSLCFGLLAFSTMAIVRGSARSAELATAGQLADLLSSQLQSCSEDDACAMRVVEQARAGGVITTIHERPMIERPRWMPATSERPPRLIIERAASDRVLAVEFPLTVIAERIQRGTMSLVLTLLFNAVALVVIGTLLFERAVVRRLTNVEEQMASIERLELDAKMLSSDSGDAFGRMTGTLRRVTEKLREDKLKQERYIAELEQTNRALRETQESLTRSDRLATVGRLAAGVAHEVGNPVAAILGYLEIVRTIPQGASPEYLERIEREAKRVDRIVRDLIDFARPQPLLIGPVDLTAAIGSSVRLVQPQPRWRSMRLENHVPTELPTVAGQEHHIVQVLLNLLINAADAAEGKGVVRISAAATEAGVDVSISDNGPGIPEAHLSRIFDPFFTTKPPGEGTGLGLAICHRLMEAFGGSISVANLRDGGAAFTLHFKRYIAGTEAGNRAA